jgi:hypothetical protein
MQRLSPLREKLFLQESFNRSVRYFAQCLSAVTFLSHFRLCSSLPGDRRSRCTNGKCLARIVRTPRLFAKHLIKRQAVFEKDTGNLVYVPLRRATELLEPIPPFDQHTLLIDGRIVWFPKALRWRFVE